MTCFAHTFQLVVKDGLKSADQLTKVLCKTSTIVSSVCKSTHATDILEGEHRLQTANATSWNSQLTMIRSVLRVSEEKRDSLDLPTKLTQYDRNILTEACDILACFKEVTDLVQRDKTVSASLNIPSILGPTSQLGSIQAKYHTKFLTTLKSSITRRLAPYTTRSVLQCATVLDPQFKLKWCSSSDEASSVKDIILAEATRITPPDTEQPRKRSKLFSFMGMSYWQHHASEFPTLSKLARQSLTIPTSSAPVERLFSVAGKIFRPDRCSFKDTTFETLMFLCMNTK